LVQRACRFVAPVLTRHREGSDGMQRPATMTPAQSPGLKNHHHTQSMAQPLFQPDGPA
jgi:hypothetical protein